MAHPLRGRPIGPNDEGEPPDDLPEEAGDRIDKDPRQAPILDWLENNGPGTASQIAAYLGRKPANVLTRLRQYEEGGFVRRTGRMVSGASVGDSGRGGPRVEWELCDPKKPPTGPEDILEAPETTSLPDRAAEQAEFRRAYFEKLLEMLDADGPEHLFERVERLAGLS